MSQEDFPRISLPALALSLHEDMSPEEISRLHADAAQVAYHAEVLVMQRWLLSLADGMRPGSGVNAIEISFDEETPDATPKVKVHTDAGIIKWHAPNNTSIKVASAGPGARANPNAHFDLEADLAIRAKLDAHRNWIADAMQSIPSSIRARGAINDVARGEFDEPIAMDRAALLEMSLSLAIPDPDQVAQFKAAMQARQLNANTAPPHAPASPRQRV